MSQEYAYTDDDFYNIQTIVKNNTGISLDHSRKEMVYGRISRRLRQLGINSFKSYLHFLEENRAIELENFTNAITTNLTAFFREPHHFEFLNQALVPFLENHHIKNRELKIWSAGCSTGEEPYSIAMEVARTLKELERWNVKILATDLDSEVLENAKKGIYDLNKVEGLNEDYQTRWFLRGKNEHQGKIKISKTLKSMIRFKKLNLLDPWPITKKFDLIFCRNVIIYFDKETKIRLFERFADCLSDNGYMLIGHSESLHNTCKRFELIGKTIYRKIH